MSGARRLRLVLDTNVLVAALRSRAGSSNALLGHLAASQHRIVTSTALLFEYEAVLSRPTQLAAFHLTVEQVAAFLDTLARRSDRVSPHFSWRPQLADAGDEMVLEAAVNGRVDAIVTFNVKHLAPAAGFGVDVWTPGEALEVIRHGSGSPDRA